MKSINTKQEESFSVKCAAKIFLMGPNPWSPCPYDAAWVDVGTGKVYCIVHADQIERERKETEIKRGEFT